MTKHWSLRRSAVSVAGAAALLVACAQGPVGPSNDEPGAPAVPKPLQGYDGTWYWMGTVTAAGASVPDQSQRFSAEFATDGTLAVLADCNRGRGRYAFEGRTLRVTGLATTRAACPGGATGTEYVAQLQSAGLARIADGLLELDAAAGSMVFSRRPDQRLAIFRCVTGGTVFALLAPDRALVRWQGRSFRLTRVVGVPGVRFRGDAADLSSKGPEAVLEVDGRPAGEGCTLSRPSGSAGA